jgi:hypothetical protein
MMPAVDGGLAIRGYWPAVWNGRDSYQVSTFVIFRPPSNPVGIGRTCTDGGGTDKMVCQYLLLHVCWSRDERVFLEQKQLAFL